MAKYYELVGSVYIWGKYQDQEVVKLDNVSLKTIEDIDKFTSLYPDAFAISNKLGEKYQNKNHYSIRVTNNKGTVYYQRVIYDIKDLDNIISKLKKNTIYTINGYRNVKLVPTNNVLFAKSFQELEDLINNKDIERIEELFNKDSKFTFLVKRFIESNSYEEQDYEALQNIELNFQNYEVFRKYLANKSKKKISNLKVKKNLDTDYSLKKEPSKGFGYNVAGSEETVYEEFFEEDEIAEMVGGDIDAVPLHKGHRI